MSPRPNLVPCSGHNYGLIGLKPARCKEPAARTGFVNPLSRRDAADGRFKANPSGGGQGAAGFVARRQRMYPYVILLASRPQPLGPPSTRNYGWNMARAMTSIGKVYGNIMVDVDCLKNSKLVDRGARIIMRITGATRAEAMALLHRANGNVKRAIAPTYMRCANGGSAPISSQWLFAQGH